MKKKTMNVYLFTPLCQAFFVKSEKHHYSPYRHIERKLRQLNHKCYQDNLSATIHCNLIYRYIGYYIRDIESEMMKYNSLIKNNMLISSIRKKSISQTHVFSDINPLSEAMNHALIVTDKLAILLKAAFENNNFDHEKTYFLLCNKLKGKFDHLTGRVHRLSMKEFFPQTVSEFFNLSLPSNEKNKVMDILNIGFVQKYKTVRRAA